MSLGGRGGGGARSLKGGAQGGRDPQRFGPGGARSRGGGEIPGTPETIWNRVDGQIRIFFNSMTWQSWV